MEIKALLYEFSGDTTPTITTSTVWTIVSRKYICWKLTPKLMLLGGGAFGRCLGQKGALVDKIGGLITKRSKDPLPPSTRWGYNENLANWNPEEVLQPNLTFDSCKIGCTSQNFYASQNWLIINTNITIIMLALIMILSNINEHIIHSNHGEIIRNLLTFKRCIV